MSESNDTQYMSMALELAERGRFTVTPNPMVGCVIVKNGKVIGSGYHLRAGQPHAEIYALGNAGIESRDATVYLTLEPCCHQGRTPPCVKALIEARVKKVIVACVDPNPLVSGKGIAALREAGIDVEVGMLQAQAKKLNEIFFHYMQNKRPFVILKWAMSMDGKTITNPGDSRQISGELSQKHTHQLRQSVDAILVGSRTVSTDNPHLTARLPHTEASGKQPLRIILTTRGNLPLDLRVFNSSSEAKTLIATTDAAEKSWLRAMMAKNIDIIILPKNSDGKVDLNELLDELGKRNITSLLVEGGMTVHHNFLLKNLASKVVVYIAGVLIGEIDKKHKLHEMELLQLGDDFCISGLL